MRSRWVLALVAVVGCNFGSPEAQTIDNSCANDASCPVGVCDGNICIDDSGASVDVAIEVLSSSSDLQRVTPASWAFAAEPISGPSTRDLVLPATREVVGSVRWDGFRVPATLRFVRRMVGAVAPLVPVAIEVDTLRESAVADGEDAYDFSTVLVAGETYDVSVLPSNDMVTAPMQTTAPAIRSLPPIYMELAVDDGDPSEPFRFDVAFPAGLADGCTENVDIGCTLEAEVLSVNAEGELPEAGLQVRAIEKTTARVVSSIGETDENGRFAIRISDAAADYLIRVTSSVGRDPFPAVSVDPDVAFAADPIKKRIYIPRLTPVQFTGRVRDMDDSPVPGATVRFLSTGIFGGNELGLEGSFSGSATTDAEGSFGVELLPGFYSVTVTPPEDVENTWGVLTAESLVGEEITATEALIVPSQIGLRGWVATFRDEAAVGVTILARARLSEDLGARSQEAVSNGLGAFAMSVDVGLYDTHVKTSSETGFAWLVEPELVMSTEAGDSVRGYRLDPPIPVRGVIRTGAGEVVPHALIRAYVLTSTTGAASRPIQVAETLSGEDGSYRLLIAPRLGDE
ncbi:MAG: carboxypeptidase regulatory-like domain-containing protein [Deltaproteobacteria bacterium]|nr:carboxypeptidase regulatory-like domain-containing protein [Deltaproteobacteria bacterium]MBW2403340.1 carboxypeptidase regulatory-like domain-containing protein [Deltaproteobacteria bacterium]